MPYTEILHAQLESRKNHDAIQLLIIAKHCARTEEAAERVERSYHSMCYEHMTHEYIMRSLAGFIVDETRT